MTSLQESAALYENVLRAASAHRARMGERRSIELDARIDERLDVLRQNITRIMAENERLRAALKSIAGYATDPANADDLPLEAVRSMTRIARAALAGPAEDTKP